MATHVSNMQPINLYQCKYFIDRVIIIHVYRYDLVLEPRLNLIPALLCNNDNHINFISGHTP